MNKNAVIEKLIPTSDAFKHFKYSDIIKEYIQKEYIFDNHFTIEITKQDEDELLINDKVKILDINNLIVEQKVIPKYGICYLTNIALDDILTKYYMAITNNNEYELTLDDGVYTERNSNITYIDIRYLGLIKEKYIEDVVIYDKKELYDQYINNIEKDMKNRKVVSMKCTYDYYFSKTNSKEQAYANAFGYMFKSIKIEPKTKKRLIYFIKNLSNQYIKIGITTNLEKRIKQLQSNKFHKLEVIATTIYDDCIKVKTEKSLHDYFKDKNIKGEWFNVTIDDIKNACSDLGIELLKDNTLTLMQT